MKTVPLKKRSLLYVVWSWTFRLYDYNVPKTTSICAVWRRVILFPAILLPAILLYPLFWSIITFNLARGSWSIARNERGRYEIQDMPYNGLTVGRHEIYPIHGLVACLIALCLWCSWQTIALGLNQVTPWIALVGLLSGIVFVVVLLAVTFATLIFLVQRNRVWFSSLKEHWCAKVEIVE